MKLKKIDSWKEMLSAKDLAHINSVFAGVFQYWDYAVEAPPEDIDVKHNSGLRNILSQALKKINVVKNMF